MMKGAPTEMKVTAEARRRYGYPPRALDPRRASWRFGWVV